MPSREKISVYVVRAFAKQREALAANAEILKKLAVIDKTMIENDNALQILWKGSNPCSESPNARSDFTPATADYALWQNAETLVTLGEGPLVFPADGWDHFPDAGASTVTLKSFPSHRSPHRKVNSMRAPAASRVVGKSPNQQPTVVSRISRSCTVAQPSALQ
jgi:hypothetical protein